jgi:SnoaL-like domain
MTTARTAKVLDFFAAFQTQNEAAARAMVAGGFTFTSPQDDHLDVAKYFEVCFPTAAHFASQTIMETAEAGDTVLVRYEYELADGSGRFRNMEALTVEDSGLISEVQVYFGGGV